MSNDNAIRAKKDRKSRITPKNAAYVFMAPGIILFAIFGLYPLIMSFYYSFLKKIGTKPTTFIGLDNYTRAFKDPVFITSLKNILVIFIMHAPIMILLSLVLAYVLNQKSTKLKNLFKTSLFVPNVTNAVAFTLIFRLLLSNDGVINEILANFGIEPILWLATPLMGKWTISIMTIWRWTGYNMIIFLAAMQNIDYDIYEASEIDGANKVQQFFRIVIPLMKNPIFFTTIMTVSGTLGMFAESQLLVQGGPNYGTMTPALYLYNTAWKQFDFGYAAAISYILSIITILIAIIQFNLGKERKPNA